MNKRPTPRTEAMIAAHSEEDDRCGAIILCRTLEREVDELREALQNLLDYLETDDMRPLDMNKARTALKNTEPK